MGLIKPSYGSAGVALACTFGNNPTGTVTAHGRLSDAIDNSVDCFEEVMLQGVIKTSASTPINDKLFIVYGLGSSDGGTHYTDGYAAGNADSAVVPVSARAIANVPAPSASTIYSFGPARVSLAFGGDMPSKWMVNVFNDHGVTPSVVNADHAFWYQGRYTQYS